MSVDDERRDLERGPKGDHGQTGDKGKAGDVGDTGDTGETGDPGDPGERGATGDPGSKGAKGDKGDKGEPEPIHPWRWRALSAWIVVFTAVWVSSIREDRHQTQDIQEARVTSCERTYEGIREVFTPLFPPVETRTKEQQDNLDKFNKSVDDLKAGCPEQTGVK